MYWYSPNRPIHHIYVLNAKVVFTQIEVGEYSIALTIVDHSKQVSKLLFLWFVIKVHKINFFFAMAKLVLLVTI